MPYADPNSPAAVASKRRRAATWRKRHRERYLASNRANARAYRVRMTPDEYAAMAEAQNGRCLLCGEFPEGKGNFVMTKLTVDHDPKTGKVRGLLCAGCNAGLGQFRDNVEALRLAALYVEGKTFPFHM